MTEISVSRLRKQAGPLSLILLSSLPDHPQRRAPSNLNHGPQAGSLRSKCVQTHAGPGSSAIAQQAQFITVWVFALWAAH